MVRWSLVVVALVGSLMTNRVALAGEVPPPAGANITFDTGSPLPGPTHLTGQGSYTVPANWSKSEIRLRIFKVKAGGQKGDYVTQSANAGSLGANGWLVGVSGLQPNTEYWVEARMKLTTGGILGDYAYVNTDGVKVKTTGGGGIEE